MIIRDTRGGRSWRQKACVGERRTIHATADEPIKNNAQQITLLLKQCGSPRSLPDGRLLHFVLVEKSSDGIAFFPNRLLRMYAHCGSPSDARSLFDIMDQKDPHSWRYIVKAYASNVKDSLQLFQQMMMEGFLPVTSTLMSILAACTGASSLVHGMRIHACIFGSEFLADVDVGNNIINMYNRCEDLRCAMDFFDSMLAYNVVTFNTLIAALVQHNKSEETSKIFRQMQLKAVSPNEVTFISIVSAVAALARLGNGVELHTLAICSDFASDVTLNNALLNMYGKCGSLSNAERLFWAMPSREVVTWSCMIMSYILHKRHEDALQLFQHMKAMGFLPNNATFTNVLSACACKAALPEVKRLHLWVVGAKSETDVVLGTALVNTYSKCGGLEEAVQVFRHMSSWDTVLWNAMIEAHVKACKSREAIELFEEMQLKGITPTNVTFIVLLDAFATLEEGKYIHAVISRYGFDTDPLVGTGLITLYNRCCSLCDVHEVFDNMPDHDLFSWNALLAGISRHGSVKEALCKFQMMMFEGVIPNCISFINLCDACHSIAASKEALWIHAQIAASNLEKDVYVVKSVIIMYGKVGNLEQAQRVFEGSTDHDEITFNAMITVYSLSSHTMKALSLYRQMQSEGILRGRFTLIDLISGFVNAETVAEGRRVHATIVRSPFEEDVTVTNTLLNMYGKCGTIEEARMLFDRVNKQDIYTWSVLLTSYAQQNKGSEALLTFQRMCLECMLPDKVTFVSVTSACGSQGFIAEGRQMHVWILENDFRSDLNLCSALISMYGKCGSVKDATKVFDKLQSGNVVTWNALLTVYALHGHGKEALQLYYRMLQDNIMPNSITYSVILSACSHSGLLKEGLECFISMGQDHGVKPTEDLVNYIIDLLCRAGLLDEGESIVKSFLSQPTSVTWTILSGWCKMHWDCDRGERVARSALQLAPNNSSLYVLLSNFYASPGSKKETMMHQSNENMVSHGLH
ncbi:hypothetical protein L7F22_056501 [Adiantum nelumboides]|nr:hypothetical protein [Adiantum nelumboides]